MAHDQNKHILVPYCIYKLITAPATTKKKSYELIFHLYKLGKTRNAATRPSGQDKANTTQFGQSQKYRTRPEYAGGEVDVFVAVLFLFADIAVAAAALANAPGAAALEA